MNTSSDTHRLAQLVSIKHDLLAQLRTLAERQIEVIAADDVNRLMMLLAEKQTLLSQLQRVERTLDPYRHEDADARRWASAEDRRQCQLVADRANTLLAELLVLEKEAERQLIASREQTARELETTTQALAARQAYFAPAAASPGGLDLMSET